MIATHSVYSPIWSELLGSAGVLTVEPSAMTAGMSVLKFDILVGIAGISTASYEVTGTFDTTSADGKIVTISGSALSSSFIVDGILQFSQNLSIGIENIISQSGNAFSLNQNLIDTYAINVAAPIDGRAASNDLITGGIANDSINGDKGNDTLNGGLGNDTLIGGLGNDSINGGDGNDSIFNSGGTDTLIGGLGDDIYNIDLQISTVIENLNSGFDSVNSTISIELRENIEVLTLTGTSSINGSGNSLNNKLVGNGADNILNGGLGSDTMVGGAGNDTYFLDSVGDKVFETTTAETSVDAGGVDTVKSGVTHALGDFFENLSLTGTVAINGTGNGLGNTLLGNIAANVLDGGAGVDVLVGGAGNDNYVVDNIADTVFETTTVTSIIDAGGIDLVKSSVTFTVRNFVENLTLTGSEAINGTGNSLANTLIGNEANNSLNGAGGVDIMVGGAGNDTYVVDNVSDKVLETTTALTRIDAGGVDTVKSSVNFTLGSFVEKLTLAGSSAINGTGNGLDNTLLGNIAANLLDGGVGADIMIGGAGNDIYVIDSVSDRVYETTTTTSGIDAGGVDLVKSNVNFTLGAFFENLTLTNSGVTNGTGNSLKNTLVGNASGNTLDGRAGADVMVGMAGNDIYIVDNVGDKVFETTSVTSFVNAGGIDLVKSSVNFGLSNFVENLTLTGTGNINATGNSMVNRLLGNNAANVLDGGAGADVMIGGVGNDIYIVDNIGDKVFETTMTTTLTMTNIDAGGIDVVKSGVSYVLGAFIENLTLTGASVINGTGNSLANTVLGNSVENVLDGGLGADVMVGGAGNDIYVVDNVGDKIFETTTATSTVDAGGVDLVKSSLNFVLGGFTEKLTLTGIGIINGTGNSLNNELTGNSAANVLNGGTGADIMIGGAGNDIYIVDNVGDKVFETVTAISTVNANGVDLVKSSVSFTMSNFIENLTLTGTLAINGTGNASANILIGNSAVNVLDGGAGKDVLTGGAGNDVFDFNSLTDMSTSNSMADVITDFTAGDKIDLSSLDANSATLINDSFKFLGSTAFSTTDATGQLRYAFNESLNSGFIYGSTDIDVQAEFSIMVNGVSNLAPLDFFL